MKFKNLRIPRNETLQLLWTLSVAVGVALSALFHFGGRDARAMQEASTPVVVPGLSERAPADESGLLR